jgi:Smg protein
MMFDILMYLFETYIHSDIELLMDHDELTDELTRAGFHKEEIYKALDWLEQLAALQDSDQQPYLNPSDNLSIRIYTAPEMDKLDVGCRGFLMFLEQIKVLTQETREMVIDRVMELDSPEIELEDLKWIILMVLFNVPGSESAYQQMEELLFDLGDGPLH